MRWCWSSTHVTSEWLDAEFTRCSHAALVQASIVVVHWTHQPSRVDWYFRVSPNQYNKCVSYGYIYEYMNDKYMNDNYMNDKYMNNASSDVSPFVILCFTKGCYLLHITFPVQSNHGPFTPTFFYYATWANLPNLISTYIKWKCACRNVLDDKSQPDSCRHFYHMTQCIDLCCCRVYWSLL